MKRPLFLTRRVVWLAIVVAFLAGVGLVASCRRSRSPSAQTEVAPPPPETTAPATAEAQGCPLPPMPDHGNCRWREPVFLGEVEDALDEVIDTHPEIFDLDRITGCSRCYYIVDVQGYERQVVKALERRGLCAHAGEEFGVKNSNDFNEQYDLETAAFFIRRQLGSYQATCHPAAF